MQDQNNNQIKVNNQDSLVIRINPETLFEGDSYGLFVFKKTERIVTAIYLLTGVMSDKEPMREKLRGLATDMLSTAFGMSERVWGEEIFQKNLASTVCEISTLFDIAETTKMISKMNHKIIAEELKKLSDFLKTSSQNYSSAKIAFEPTLFDGDYNYVSENNFQKKNIIQNTSDKGHTIVKDILVEGEQNKMSVKKVQSTNRTSKDKINRQDVILGMLKDGSKLTIKDFAKNIRDCGEKTIQRELLSMVSKGLLKKEGERRWSKYFLA